MLRNSSIRVISFNLFDSHLLVIFPEQEYCVGSVLEIIIHKREFWSSEPFWNGNTHFHLLVQLLRVMLINVVFRDIDRLSIGTW